MKFAEQLESQMVPEWKEAYMDYNYLKSLLLEIHRFKQSNVSVTTPKDLKRKMTLYRAFSGLTERYHNLRSPRGGGDVEDQVILISSVQKDASDDNDRYKTTFLMANEEGAEHELVFFRRLDDEFNKVVNFYEDKVKEVLNEAALLNKQMDALIAFRVKVEDPAGSIDWSLEMTRLRSSTALSEEAERRASSPNAVRSTNNPKDTATKQGRVHMDVIEESGYIQEENPEEPGNDARGARSTGIDTTSRDEKMAKATNTARTKPNHLKILDHVRFNNTLETPHSTILKCNKNHLLKFNQEELSRIEEKIKVAFIEFYQKLRLVKSYSFLNLLAVSKIMKKYDKVTSRNASKQYLKMVDNSYLGGSDVVNKLMERVEHTFIKHFFNANRREGMRMLRPKAKKERHRVTYFMGFFSGCTLSLMVALILITRARGLIGAKGGREYMENMFPLYSLFAFAVLHLLMYAMDIYLWRRYRVNYPFIFGFNEGRGLGYREVLLVSTALATLALASVISNLDMEMNLTTNDYGALTELLPLGLVILVVLIMLCPFNIIYRSSRWFLLSCLFHCMCAPLYKVTLPDFLFADNMTSQVQAIRSLEFYICYYGWGDYKQRRNTCNNSPVYKTFNFITATIPYWWRFLQCLRRLFEEKDSMHIYNALKYFSTIVAVCMRTAYILNNSSMVWKILAWITSAIAAISSTYWDIVIDWGLLQRHSKNRWLRDKLLVPHKFVYFGAMVLNVLLRFAWMQTVLNFQVSFLHRQVLIAVVASLEIIRRGIWNFFRLENEHLYNVGKYRAFRSLPLPFYYLEGENKDG